jgi:uncharacterized protein
MNLIRILTGLVAGIIFAFGLGTARLTLPQTIHGGLDVLGAWDPQMFIALFAGMLVFGVFRIIVMGRAAPLLASRFRLPAQGRPSARMLLGSALFGAAWGFSGICPGPSLTSSLTSFPVAVFAISMIAGVAFYERTYVRRAVRPHAAGK